MVYNWRMIIFVAALVLLTAQTVFTKDPPPNYCFEIEHIRPNLEVEQAALVRGQITDFLGSPFKSVRVELRKYISEKEQTPFIAVQTDGFGYYDFGKVPAGRYRLLGSATRAFKQPEGLKCSSKDCYINMRLQVNATHEPDSTCPVR